MIKPAAHCGVTSVEFECCVCSCMQLHIKVHKFVECASCSCAFTAWSGSCWSCRALLSLSAPQQPGHGRAKNARSFMCVLSFTDSSQMLNGWASLHVAALFVTDSRATLCLHASLEDHSDGCQPPGPATCGCAVTMLIHWLVYVLLFMC